jgi:ABC-2 type transport system permease protein
MGIVVCFFLFDGIVFTRYSLLFLVYMVELYLIIIGISFLLSVVYLKFRDLVEIWTIIMTAGFYATPIIWPVERLSEQYRKLIYINPLAIIVQYSKRVLVEGRIADAAGGVEMFVLGNVLILAESVLLFVIGFLVFRRMSPRAAEYL